MIRIVHFSDWHGHWEMLPKADLYICTGDMAHNHHAAFIRGRMMPDLEEALQDEDFHKLGSLRKFLGSPDAPVVVVRGNHDYVDFGPKFGGECFEITDDPNRTVEYCGFKIGGFRGVPPVGDWNDLLTPHQFQQRLNGLPEDLDILVTHGPPKHILSCIWGSIEYTGYFHDRYIDKKQLPKLCCFGHIHEEGRKKASHYGVLFSNASLGKNIIDFH